MIFTGFSPNLTGRDTLIALSWLLFPWKWRSLSRGDNPRKAEDELKKYFGFKSAYTFDSGRTALYFALKALGIKEGDEVIVQAYTCVVVVNAIRWTGAQPVYVDIADDFNMDARELEKKITDKVKAVIVQHTYGLPADLELIMRLAKKHGLKIIEDCAHSFGAKHDGKLTGTFGDIGMFSFGSDKILSCIRGGALITNNDNLGEALKDCQAGLKPMPGKIIIQHLLHYPVFYIGKALYGIIIGKAILALAKKLNVINKIITPEEKAGKKDQAFGRALPNALSAILLNQLKEVDKINEKRKKIAGYYSLKLAIVSGKPARGTDECIFLRYPILLDNPKELMRAAKNKNILLGDWYNSVIAPRDSVLAETGYIKGSCPRAERMAERIVNLPTGRGVDKSQADKIAKLVNSFLEK
ncbi:MAG: aminotransferase class I/II-fold pyridoxal phosphate-dependent enzyme [Patescibacteria group bacterium]|jgi:dTDP-4-amino-4,6-dideoxygalactose transaminase